MPNSIFVEPSALATSNGVTIAVGASGNQAVLTATQTDHGAIGSYMLAASYTANPGDAARGDHGFSFGYNVAPGGARLNTAEPCFSWTLEDYYAPGGGSPGPYLESYWQYFDALGASYRPIACQIDRTNGGYLTNATLSVTASAYSYLAMNGSQYVKCTAGLMQLLTSTVLQSETNNVAFLKQINAAAGAYLPIAFIDSSNYLRLGGGTSGVVAADAFFVGSSSACKLTNFADQGMVLQRADNTGAYFVFVEQVDPGVASADQAKLYVRDNGSSKTQLCVMFSSGASIVLATQV